MKRILAILSVLLIISTAVCSASADQAAVMTSFYPMYIFALNVFQGIDEISVDCMTAPKTGCLHDYQLVVGDMIKLSESDLFIVCGAGMELYLDDIAQQFPQLPVLECSEGLNLIENCSDEEHDHEHEHDHDHGHNHAVNPHTWLDIDNAIKIVETIAASGIDLFPEYANQIRNNSDAYTAKLSDLKDALHDQLAFVQGKSAVTFHEGFSYFAHAFGINAVAVISHEEENGLQPAQIFSIINKVEEAGVPPIFADLTGTSSAAHTVAAETNGDLFHFDPIVTGENSPEAYENAMIKNAESVLDAFSLN